ncbi:MAG TPA: DNA-directed RNA polymerase subunit D [Candidatus Pacearchaeota archaeon]|nr:DNA-directed RNA polymerase subunit D [Candidatus Pacearchaeota archaeon]
MQIIEQKPNQITFRAEISESLANAIRRHINQIPILAIDEVEIVKNDSALYDETVAHRIGLIPLKMDKSVSEKTEMDMSLSAKGEGFVYSGKFTGGLGVVYDKLPITYLEEEQELQLVAHAKTGRGVEHSKFSPGFLYYRNVSEIKIDADLYDEFKKICPNNEVKKEGKSIIIHDNLKIEVSDVCEEICRKNNRKLEITPKNELVITVESVGQLDVKDVFLKSVDALQKDLDLISKKVK